ncbi:MAG TPA: SIS domain-containing protein [Thermoplasmata archaeon]|nr:SIS domain-containing protein [Thermoplasmata archaeon]
MRKGPSAGARGTAEASARYLLDHVKQILAVDRSKDIQASVEVLTSAKKLFVYGVGRSGLAARAFAMRMVQLGIDCYFIGETITPVVNDGDAVLIVSNTGSTMSAIQVANIARRVGAKVISVTGHRASKLANASNVVLLIHVAEDRSQARLAPLGTLFEDATVFLLDGLVAEIMERLGQTESDMRGRHAIMV